jgi:hypothetical protein
VSDLPDTPGDQWPGSDAPGAPEGATPPVAPSPAPRPSGDGDSRKLMLAVGILLLVALVAVGVGVARSSSKSTSSDAGATTTTTAKPGAGCVAGTWPALYQGKPNNLDAATDTGYYLWNEPTGWRLRAIDTTSAATFRVKITADVKLDAKLFKAVPANAFEVTVKNNSATFDMPGGPTATGVDFSLPCATSQIGVEMGTPQLLWPTKTIWVGKDNTAVTNPVAVLKQSN